MKTETLTVYHNGMGKHMELEVEIVQAYYYECESNYGIHRIAETTNGLLVQFLGDSYSQYFPGESFPEDPIDALNLANYLMS